MTGPQSPLPAAAASSAETGRSSHTGGGKLLLSAIVAALGSFLFGFDTAVISGTTDSLRTVFHLDPHWLGVTVSSALFGTMVGALFAGRPADWWGRRKMLGVLAVFFVVASLGCALAWNWTALVFFRWLGGVAVGAASVVCPVYITEIAPAHRRGLLVAVSQLNIVFGMLFAYFSNYVVALMIGADQTGVWRWMFGVMLIPSVLFLVFAGFLPESPRWLVKKNRLDDAQAVLARLGHSAPDQELAEIKTSLQSEMSGVHASVFHRRYLKPLLLACTVAVFNQLDGINAVLYYTADIFRLAGATNASALMQSVIVGLTNLVITVIAMGLIDRVGRKGLLLAGSVTFVMSHCLAAYAFHTHAHGPIMIIAMMGIVGSHAYSQGAVVWVIINELLPNAVRASGSAVACILMWTLCAAIALEFPAVAAKSGASVFGFFAVMMVVQFFLFWKYLPETKGLSLEELEKRLGVEGGPVQAQHP